ncbi:MAG TPA: glycosyltransferase [Vicinamibacterales bacterium]|nr:glycosyltransferase [Vicinamibacterales bacterium]
MRLDVIIPTFNRAPLLRRALESLLTADRPERLDVSVTVVDNRSTDDTRSVVESFEPRFEGRLHYLYEPDPGRSNALNTGIAASRADLVGMIDDDEQVDRGWLLTIAAAFEDPTTDFIGGPYLPVWGGDRPVWLGRAYGSVVGWAECGDTIQQFGPPFEAMLMGGNAVIRRSVLERVGPYAVDLGRTPGGRLLSCEDEDMFARLLLIGARGFYRPDLIIHHYVPPERLTKRYFRRWCFWRGVSLGLLERRRPAPVPHLLGVPRYMVGLAVRGTIDSVRSLFRRGEAARLFKNELAWWDLAGFVYGRHFSGIDQYISRIARLGEAALRFRSQPAAGARR